MNSDSTGNLERRDTGRFVTISDLQLLYSQHKQPSSHHKIHSNARERSTNELFSPPTPGQSLQKDKIVPNVRHRSNYEPSYETYSQHTPGKSYQNTRIVPNARNQSSNETYSKQTLPQSSQKNQVDSNAINRSSYDNNSQHTAPQSSEKNKVDSNARSIYTNETSSQHTPPQWSQHKIHSNARDRSTNELFSPHTPGHSSQNDKIVPNARSISTYETYSQHTPPQSSQQNRFDSNPRNRTTNEIYSTIRPQQSSKNDEKTKRIIFDVNDQDLYSKSRIERPCNPIQNENEKANSPKAMYNDQTAPPECVLTPNKLPKSIYQTQIVTSPQPVPPLQSLSISDQSAEPQIPISIASQSELIKKPRMNPLLIIEEPTPTYPYWWFSRLGRKRPLTSGDTLSLSQSNQTGPPPAPPPPANNDVNNSKYINLGWKLLKTEKNQNSIWDELPKTTLSDSQKEELKSLFSKSVLVAKEVSVLFFIYLISKKFPFSLARVLKFWNKMITVVYVSSYLKKNTKVKKK